MNLVELTKNKFCLLIMCMATMCWSFYRGCFTEGGQL